jgi:hypothetical protein
MAVRPEEKNKIKRSQPAAAPTDCGSWPNGGKLPIVDLYATVWIGDRFLKWADLNRRALYIEPDYRGGGIGKALLTGIARWALSRGMGRLKWDVLAGNENAERFYQSLADSRIENGLPGTWALKILIAWRWYDASSVGAGLLAMRPAQLASLSPDATLSPASRLLRCCVSSTPPSIYRRSPSERARSRWS